MRDKVRRALCKALENNKDLSKKQIKTGCTFIEHYVDPKSPGIDYAPISKPCVCGEVRFLVITKQKVNSEWCHLVYCLGDRCETNGYFLPFIKIEKVFNHKGLNA